VYGPSENKFEWESISTIKRIIFAVEPKIFKKIILIYLNINIAIMTQTKKAMIDGG
tara:strand:- start:294 stop:461 length:168 start_codon:yes stop_codon:yes gene_type:complete